MSGKTSAMNRFSATTESEAVVAAERSAIWAALTDPVLLPKLTPLLQRIETDGDVWRWHMLGIAVLGVGISPIFTERMRFDEGRRIDYSHEPPKGVIERTGAEGWYALSDVQGGTRLAISLTLHVELPLSKVAAPAVTRVMKGTMQRTGDRFSTNLLHHLRVEGAALPA
jgi:carbon monoxide dehydrogenase subunit G